MTPQERERYERIERVLELVAHNQEELSAYHNRFSAELGSLKEITAMHTVQIEAHGRQIEAQAKQAGMQGSQMGELGNLVVKLGRIMEEQASAQTRTDERLNALIIVVERYFSNGRN